MSNSFIAYDSASLEQRVAVYAVPKALANAVPWLFLEKHAKKEMLPKNKSDTLKWKRFVPFNVDTTSLIEGVTPSFDNFQMETVTDTIDQYGKVVAVSDKFHDLHSDAGLNDISAELGKNIGAVREALSWETVRAGTQVIYSGTATSRIGVNDIVTLNQVRQATNILSANHGEFLAKMIGASANTATEPVAPSFIGAGSRDLDGDLRDLDKFVEAHKYGQPGAALSEYEIGACEGVRFQLTPHLKPFLGAGDTNIAGIRSEGGVRADVYPLVIMAKDFWGITTLAGSDSVKVTIVPPGKASVGNELGQKGFASWIMYFCATRLNERWGVRIEAAASDFSA